MLDSETAQSLADVKGVLRQTMQSSIQEKMETARRIGLSKSMMRDFLRTIVQSRRVDDAEISMKKQNKAFFQIAGAGHEGVLVAAAAVLKPAYDFFIPYYRDRALCLGLGVTPYEMLCQANGNIGDTASHGRQMPSHWGNRRLNIVSKTSCTGTQFLHACGVAEAGEYLSQLKKMGLNPKNRPFNEDEIIYVSSGDGTTSEGEFWEGITTACVNRLPVLFMIEDNGYAISVPVATQTPGGSISKALANFPGLKIFEVDGSCPILSYAVLKEAEKHLRQKKGPVLVHAHVTRPYSHSLSDDHVMYRSAAELEQEKIQDVINSYPKTLLEAGVMTQAEIDKLFDEVSKEVKAAMSKALETPWPDPKDSLRHLCSETVDMTSSKFETVPTFSGKNDVPLAGAINRVLRAEIERDNLIRVFGEDVADFGNMEKMQDPTLKGKGGVFKVTSGLQRAGVPGQVFNSPLAEANIIGRGIGMALRGLKPVVEIQFFDYIWPAYMQLKNEMATLRYRSGGDYTCPMVVRVPIGGYLRGGAMYHSQSGESLFTHIPGIKVAYPSNALDAAGLLRTAIRGDDPVLFLEHKHLYYQGYNRTADPGNEFMIPFGKAKVVREGKHATIVAWGALVNKSLEAAKKLQAEGHEVEVIDLRTLAPFDMEAIKTSLAKTNRILIAHEATRTCGFAAEIIARINEECFELLDAPILRVTAKDSHIPYCPTSEDFILPQIDDVYQEVLTLLKY
ncbi:MAG TPA: dehydrogenase [Bdellovibrionales bacterium]|nr:dehydrogenase [Bdellovibrionales bacterium]